MAKAHMVFGQVSSLALHLRWRIMGGKKGRVIGEEKGKG
jgi:hypothetical protein